MRIPPGHVAMGDIYLVSHAGEVLLKLVAMRLGSFFERARILPEKATAAGAYSLPWIRCS